MSSCAAFVTSLVYSVVAVRLRPLMEALASLNSVLKQFISGAPVSIRLPAAALRQLVPAS